MREERGERETMQYVQLGVFTGSWDLGTGGSGTGNAAKEQSERGQEVKSDGEGKAFMLICNVRQMFDIRLR